jgi:hypothetical protein
MPAQFNTTISPRVESSDGQPEGLPTMTTITVTRADIEALCDRLDARSTSRLWDASPEHKRDLRIAVAVMRHALSIGFPIRSIEVDMPNNGTPR